MPDDPNTPQETPAPDSVQPVDSTPIDMPPRTTEAPANPEEAVSVSDAAEALLDKKDDNPANEPLKPAPTPENTPVPENPNINVERHGNDVTITEVMEKPEVSKMPFDTQTSKGFLRGLLPKLREKLGFRTEKRLAKIVELARNPTSLKLRGTREITNDDVEKLLHVSDASATNYLSKLVKRGSLRVSGPKNHAKYLPN